MTKQSNDATASTAAIVYQFYIALEKCFELREGEELLIEKDGDVSISDNVQIEVKDYDDDLSDAHENLWNTLNNWLKDSFESSRYKSLILLTTQKIGANSNLKNWANLSLQERQQVLENIKSKIDLGYQKREEKDKTSKRSSAHELINKVLDPTNETKLNEILGKFTISSCYPDSIEHVKKIKDQYCKSILKKDEYINALIGYITSPNTIYNFGWQITFESFENQCKDLGAKFQKETKIFPKKYKVNASEELVSQYEEHDFVKKVQEIGLDTHKRSAISEYYQAVNFLYEEIINSVFHQDYISYEEQHKNTLELKHYSASLETNETNVITLSKKFYVDMTVASVDPFIYYNDTEKSFRNGIYHILMQETKDLRWKLNFTNEQAL